MASTNNAQSEYRSLKGDPALPSSSSPPINDGNGPPRNIQNENSRGPTLKRPAITFKGVEAGDKYDYNSEETQFAFCENFVDLYSNEDGEYVKFSDFCKPTNDGNFPKSRFGLFDEELLDNLDYLDDIENMRPSQIATMMATCFIRPDPASGNPDFICCSSTGSGKTIAFLVPMIQKCLNLIKHTPTFAERIRNPMVLIVAHSQTVAANIYSVAEKLIQNTDIVLRFIAGNTPRLRSPYFDIGVCTIGRLRHHIMTNDGKLAYFNLDYLKYLVIDEADALTECEEFLELFIELKNITNFATLLFSATTSNTYYRYINEENYFAFGGGNINHVAASIKLFFWEVNSKSVSRISAKSYYGSNAAEANIEEYKEKELRHPFDALFFFVRKFIIEKESQKKVIVFVKRTAVADALAIRLSLYGYAAVAVHAKHTAEVYQQGLQSFIDEENKILIATKMLTRGTDIDVDYVINYDLPFAFEEWVHRCGRTGRNGNEGRAITFVDFNNNDDYPRSTLTKIAQSVDLNKKELSTVFKKFAEQAQRNGRC